jgi:hypothetical protein
VMNSADLAGAAIPPPDASRIVVVLKGAMAIVVMLKHVGARDLEDRKIATEIAGHPCLGADLGRMAGNQEAGTAGKACNVDRAASRE